MTVDVGRWRWENEPAKWAVGDDLRITADTGTDLWRVTHYGFTHDSAHMFGEVTADDLRLRVTVEADYAEQYDQAGVVLWIDGENWIKAGVEYVDGGINLSTVVTRDFSDWSMTPAAGPVGAVALELERKGDTVIVRYGLNGAEPVTMLRLAYFPPGVPALTGVMSAAPLGGGFEARFSGVELTPLSE
ncbi:DUF1349 domain-containing protein [Sphaerisporangium sp. TRM90804]|uniref:DUF1349 domain-containing protein n=1 Tax=Sphaerisporangium sp. TRM90804 TaxID=3031113 RepID=UPI00244778FA|nr:DUF1349 domain-containing protein [Sphaerisporangium sp. TRM90804]MDH2424689.1 DUF1349 domain-containing protein [Sphaerisporangium sp. TRM90804]